VTELADPVNSRDADRDAADESASSPAPARRRGGRAAVIAVASVALIVVAVVAFSIGRLSTLAEPTPTTTSAEAGFARDMQVHHLQGVELAMIVRDATDDPEVRLLGYDIATTQAQQAGQMYGWLADWGLSQAGSEPSMTWMTRPAIDGAAGHDDHATSDPGAHVPGAPMPGLATPAQVEELRGLTGAPAERRFLELMIAHHQGAVEMADAVLARSSNDVVVALAQSIVDSQTSEIDLMTGMLAERS
jgi:uncharacterized protein (DUF305 family)